MLKKSSRVLALMLVSVVSLGIIGNVANLTEDNTNNSQPVRQGISLNVGFVSAAFAKDEKKEEKPATTTTDDADKAMLTVVKMLNSIMKVLYFILVPIISLAGWLLSPDWTMGDVFNLRPILHNLWVLISNIVYVIFAFILVAMAFMNIFGSGNKTYEMKSALPKLIIGILMVPFTWFIVSATLSFTNVLTASVLQLPATVLTGTNGNDYLNKVMVSNTVYMDLTEGAASRSGTVNSAGDAVESGDLKYSANGSIWTLDCSSGALANGSQTEAQVDGGYQSGTPDRCVSVLDILNGGNSAYSVLYVYAYGIFNIQDFQSLPDDQILKIVKGISNVAEKLLFGIITFLAFSVICIALVTALAVRAFMLWIYIIFSPFFALGYFYDNKVPGLEKMKSVKFALNEFLKLAFVPVIVSAGLAFGLMFLSMIMQHNSKDNGLGSISKSSKNPDESVFTFGEFKLITIGSINQKGVGIAGGGLDAASSAIGKIIVNLLALIILWLVVKAALASSDITAKVTEPIFKFGETLAKSAPILPGGLSLGAVNTAKQTFEGMPQRMIEQQIRDSGLNEKMNRVFGVDNTELGMKARHILQGAVPATSAEKAKDARELIRAAGDTRTLLLNKEAMEALSIRIGSLNTDLGKAIKDAKDETSLAKAIGNADFVLRNKSTDQAILPSTGAGIKTAEELNRIIKGETVAGAAAAPVTAGATPAAAAAGAAAIAVTATPVSDQAGTKTTDVTVGTQKIHVQIDRNKNITVSGGAEIEGDIEESSIKTALESAGIDKAIIDKVIEGVKGKIKKKEERRT